MDIKTFTIIAHSNHGKSTLADRLIAYVNPSFEIGKVPFLDNMALEKEKNITIKAKTVRLYINNTEINLIDSPGHIDFCGEVLMSILASSASLLVVDASQGIEAQTLNHLNKALEYNHVIIPVITKIDLVNKEEIEVLEEEIYELIGGTNIPCVYVSAKENIGIESLVQAICKFVPSYNYEELSKKMGKAMVIDSWYDSYLGEQLLIKVLEGEFAKNTKIYSCDIKIHNGTEIKNIHYFDPSKIETNKLSTGSIGLITTLKKQTNNLVGKFLYSSPTIGNEAQVSANQPKIFCSFLIDSDISFDKAKENMEKLNLNDSSFIFTTENIKGIGAGFRCGFLGILHMEIIKERLSRDFNMEVSVTTPSVRYKIITPSEEFISHSPSSFPSGDKSVRTEEPWVIVTIFCLTNHVGNVIALCLDRRGEQIEIKYGKRNILKFYMPLSEIVFDFNDKIQNITNGFGNFSYEEIGFRESKLCKVTIAINEEEVSMLNFVTHINNAHTKAKIFCEGLKEILPRQQFKQKIQGMIGAKIIASETITPYRKDVTAKCYGGHQERKKKLLENQKKGKLKLQSIGRIKIPQKDMIKIFKIL